MSDRVSATRPVTHRRRRDGRPRADRYLLDELVGVLAVPLLCLVALWSVTLLAARMYEFTIMQFALALGGCLFTAGVVGCLRIRAVAVSLQGRRAAEFERVKESVGAAEQTLIWTADELYRGTRPQLPPEPPAAGDDPVEEVMALIGNLQVQGALSLLRTYEESQAAVLVAMHRTLTRRQHGLIDALLEHMTLLQMTTDDPELLHRCFHIDHLATRLRRMVESVSVVLGGQSLRETRSPVPVFTLLRGAKSEVVKYERVDIVPGDVGTTIALPAHVHPDITHLLAELIDNGLAHSSPATKVTVRAQSVAQGLLIEVEDRASRLMDPDKRERLNRLLARPDEADVAGQVRDGNLGLITSAKIAAKYDLKVWLEMNKMGGTTAHVVIPGHYLLAAKPTVGTITVPAQPAPAEPVPATPELAYAGAARPTPYADSSAGQTARSDSDPLPRRKRVPRPMPDGKGGEPAAPAPAANPQNMADWRTGLQAGMSADPPPGTPATPHS
ncbi:ATP-binding protein [Streptomyces sp. NPDC001401]|uniref:sensor histidine kinase n=1 Tax=Streptomyces sp. NPDC001401 TaxID=3364570 RepID=UPI003673B606